MGRFQFSIRDSMDIRSKCLLERQVRANSCNLIRWSIKKGFNGRDKKLARVRILSPELVLLIVNLLFNFLALHPSPPTDRLIVRSFESVVLFYISLFSALDSFAFGREKTRLICHTKSLAIARVRNRRKLAG